MPRECYGAAQGPYYPVRSNCSGPGVHLPVEKSCSCDRFLHVLPRTTRYDDFMAQGLSALSHPCTCGQSLEQAAGLGVRHTLPQIVPIGDGDADGAARRPL
jgi:hypothetical protein